MPDTVIVDILHILLYIILSFSKGQWALPGKAFQVNRQIPSLETDKFLLSSVWITLLLAYRKLARIKGHVV